jgi:hypothetical protein
VGIRREGGLRGAEREKNAHVEQVERVQVHARRGCQPWVPARVRRLYMACVAGRERVFCAVDCRADVSGLWWQSCRCLVAVLPSGGDLRGGRTEGKRALAQCSPSREPKATVQPNRRRRAPSALAKRRSGETCKHILALIRRPLCLSHSRPQHIDRLHSITRIFCQCDVFSAPTECIQVVPHNPPQTPYAMHQSTCSNRTLEPDMHRCQSQIH